MPAISRHCHKKLYNKREKISRVAALYNMISFFFKGSPPARPLVAFDPLLGFKAAFSHSSTNLMIADAHGRILYLNPAAQKLFENAAEDIRQDIPSFDPSAILGSSMDIYHKDPAKIRAMLQTVEDVRQATIVIGGRVFAQKLVPIKDENSQTIGFVVEWVDQTHNMWKEIFHAASIGLAIFESNGKIYDINETAAGYFGHTRQEMLAPDFSLESVLGDANRAYQAFEEATLSGITLGLEFAHRHKNGSTVFAKVSLRKLPRQPHWRHDRLLACITDISGLKKHEAEIEHLKTYWQNIFQGASEGMAIFTKSGRLLQANNAFCSIFSLNQAELAKPGFAWEQRLTPAEELQIIRSAAREALQQPGKAVQDEIHTLEGHIPLLASWLALPLDLHDEPLLLVTCTRIDGLKQKEAQLQHHLETQKQANALIAKALEALSQGQEDCDIEALPSTFSATGSAIKLAFHRQHAMRAAVSALDLKLSKLAQTLLATSDKLSASSKTIDGHIQASLSGVEGLTLWVQESAALSQTSKEETHLLLEQAQVYHTQLQTLQQSMEHIQHVSEKLVDILSIMKNIALQTKMLAVNTAVEASRSGHDGAGFSVIAREIQKLADQSASWLGEIRTLVHNVLQSLDQGRQESKGIAITYQQMKDTIEKIGHQMADLAGEMQVQSQSLSEFQSLLQDIAQMARSHKVLGEENKNLSLALEQEAHAYNALLAELGFDQAALAKR